MSPAGAAQGLSCTGTPYLWPSQHPWCDWKPTERRLDSLHMAVDGRDDSKWRAVRVKPLYLVAGLLGVCVLAVGVVILFPLSPDPTCASLLARSEEEVHISLPANCDRSRNVASDSMVEYFEHERSSRGLIPHEWITCKDAPAGGFSFMSDPHWLPSYVPGTYQYRRTVIIVPYGPHPILQGPRVVGEVCLMPWRRYIRQIAGQCDGKFSVWK